MIRQCRLGPVTVAFFMLVLSGLAITLVQDFDLFWQLQTGKYIWQHTGFIYSDLFTLTPNVPRYEHCWLHDLIFYGVWFWGGFSAISLFKGILITATAAILVWTARLRGSGWTSIALVLPLMLLTRGLWMERPQLWTFLCFSLLNCLLEGYDNRRIRAGFLWLTPVLMLFWVNLHAGAILLFPVLCAYLLPWALTPVFRPKTEPTPGCCPTGKLLLIAFVTLLAALITPYGAMIYQTLYTAPQAGGASGLTTQLYNMDWRPTTYANAPFFYYAVAVTVTVMALAWRRLRLTDCLLVGGLMLMGFQLQRHTPFFLFSTVALLPRYLDEIGRLVQPLIPGRVLAWMQTLLLTLILVFGLWLADGNLQKKEFFQPGLREWHFPVRAAEFVRAQNLPKNLYNTYDWGGYLAWKLYPDYLVFWDGRQGDIPMFDQGLAVMRGAPTWSSILQRHRVNTVVTRSCTIDTGQKYPLLDRLREAPDDWALVYADSSALVFVRRGTMPSEWLQHFELPAERIDDTVLSEARLLVTAHPERYMAWWEIARILVKRNEFREAYHALNMHLSYAPVGKHQAEAEQLFRVLYPLMKGEGG